MSGSGGLSKVAIALTAIFAVSLLALIAQFIYFFCRRRAFNGGAGTSGHLGLYSADSSFSSKELLYFFCIRSPQSRIGESSSVTAAGAASRQLDVDGIGVDVFKLQGIYGPPRSLFTIKEEEKEDLESPADRSQHSGDKFVKKVREIHRNNTVSLEECFKAADCHDDLVQVVVEINNDGDAMPFSTPCASPGYYTPSDSPVHEEAGDRSSDRRRI